MLKINIRHIWRRLLRYSLWSSWRCENDQS